MSEPQTIEELEQSEAYKAGVEAKKNRIPLHKAIAHISPFSWRYDAFMLGYDAKKIKFKKEG